MVGKLLIHETMPIPRNMVAHTSKQDPMPRRPHRGNSCESLPIQTITPLLDSSGNLSDLSSSLYSLDSLSSSASPYSDDNESVSASCKTSSSPQRYLSPRPRSKILNRWDSWAERTPKESPRKPKRRNIAESFESTRKVTPPTTPKGGEKPRRGLFIKESNRWFSHSESSRTLTSSPRRTLSPSRNQATKSFIEKREQDDTLDSQSFVPRLLESYLSSEKRHAHITQNMLLAEASPNRPSMKNLCERVPARSQWTDNHFRQTIAAIDCSHTRKVDSFSSEESKGSFLTCSTTCETRSSSTMSHNFSIPWCSSHDR